ncbi:MAG TPA: 2Fe-2S iron-sulfur cluster-binding protein [Catenuloplanes sp.]|jgi:2Fe-2S ferredoxin
MAKITYVAQGGVATILDVTPGDTVMRAAVNNGVDGIVGQCGGGAMCGTCHVYVDDRGGAPLPAMRDVEDELLYCTASPRRDNSRLSCQLSVTADLDGLIVHLPERQVP